jgi:hypothetical protein
MYITKQTEKKVLFFAGIIQDNIGYISIQWQSLPRKENEIPRKEIKESLKLIRKLERTLLLMLFHFIKYNSISCIPAYGRDYKSKRELLNDFNNNLDFMLCDMKHNGYFNKLQLVELQKMA